MRALPEQVEVAVVGAGFGGLGAAIRLKQEGQHDFVVLERAADVGGTWLANTYPGCQCDVPSNLYSFSFAPNPDWTHSYPEQPQIQRYLRDCAERFGVLEHTHLRCELLEAAWDADAGRWQIETSKGRLSARAIVPAPGLLSEPATPFIPGLDSFEGALFHTARWNHDHDLSGERVALLGTGATAIQVGPRIQPQVERLHVFQRTPAWILPHTDREISPTLRRLYKRAPGLQRLSRHGVYAMREVLAAGMTRERRLLKTHETAARALLRKQVPDAALRAKLTPRYEIGCKRVLLSNDWYPMLAAANTELVTERIAEVRPRSIVTADGAERELDSIVLATGFKPADPAIAYRLRGADGQLLSDVWQGSPQAYLGTAISGFPNMFMLYGPNVNLGHSSIVYMLESQIHYVLQGLRLLRRGAARSLEVRASVQRAYNEELQSRLAGTVWNTGGCSSWYFDANGRNSIMWPDFTFR
ncbi:MAG TPA: NAD(P)/FAD-dependent oxidoreductase, partial [Thermoleophilaceae bacterium]|nr:NAD(P)/FAD-dependent oxidoreductase [Thermoleophilaceae bacterium]